MADHDLITDDGPPQLRGSRDAQTGQVYFPFRAFAADGSLRLCEPVALSTEGLLVSWTAFGKECFGQIDLPDGVRVQTRLAGSAHQTGARYGLDVTTGDTGETDWRFKREQ